MTGPDEDDGEDEEEDEDDDDDDGGDTPDEPAAPLKGWASASRCLAARSICSGLVGWVDKRPRTGKEDTNQR
jgi:hypothetical protein